MKESTKEDLANHFGLELYAEGGNVMGVATTEGLRRQAIELRSSPVPSADTVGVAGEAPAEPLRRKLGRSLALPLVSDGSTWERCLEGWPRPPNWKRDDLCLSVDR